MISILQVEEAAEVATVTQEKKKGFVLNKNENFRCCFTTTTVTAGAEDTNKLTQKCILLAMSTEFDTYQVPANSSKLC